MKWKSQILITDNGRKIYYRSSCLGDTEKILLCLHGFGGDKDSSVISALAENLQCRVVAFDWPAHGESKALDDELTVENCLHDLDSMIQMLCKEYYSAAIDCFATSFGGYIATIFRNTHPGVFRHLILRSPALRMSEVVRNLVTDEEYSVIQAGGKIAMGFDRKMHLGKAFFDSLMVNEVYAIPVADPSHVMILQGDKDDVVNPEDTMKYAEKNKIQLQMFRDTDHRYKAEGDLERIIKYTEQFLMDTVGA